MKTVGKSKGASPSPLHLFLPLISRPGMGESSYLGPAWVITRPQVLVAVGDADPEVPPGVGVQYLVLAILSVLWMCFVRSLELVW